MKNSNNPICLLIGKGSEGTRSSCESLTQQGVTALVKQKDTTAQAPADTQSHWSGEPGQDLFFNGWKLLF